MATSLQKQLDNSKARVAKLTEENKALKKAKAGMQQDLRKAVAGERAATKALTQSEVKIGRLEKQLEDAGLTPITKRR